MQEILGIHPDYELWEKETPEKRNRLLLYAERQLQPYKDFVRVSDFKFAVVEQVMFLLKKDNRADLQASGVSSYKIGDISETFDTKSRPGFIAPLAWQILYGSGIRIGRLR